MPDVSKYLLKFDLEELKESLNSVRDSYTDLGEALLSQSSRVMSSMDEITLRAAGVASATTSSENATASSFSKSSAGLNSTLRMLSHMVAQSNTLTSAVRQMSDAKSSGGAPSGMQGQRAELEEMDKALQEVQAAAVQVQDASKKSAEWVEKKRQQAEKDTTMLGSMVKSEAKGVQGAVSGILGHIPGISLGGGVLAGLIAAMVHGVKVGADKEALTGEVRNILEASGESLSSDASLKFTEYFSAFAYEAQSMYRISKEESLSVLKTMVDSGYKSKQIMQEYSRYLGDVGRDIPMVTIGLDKVFELQTGTSIKHVTKMVEDYGGSLKNATSDFIKISFAGQRSGMGVENYTNAVMSASSSMKQYGVEVESVAASMNDVQKYYKSMGLSSQYAGARAEDVVKNIAESISGLPYGVKAKLAKKMFPHLEIVDAVQYFEDGFARARKGGDRDFLREVVRAAASELPGDGDNSESARIRRLELQTGWANQTAAAIIRMGDAWGKSNKLAAASKSEWDRLAKSLEDEKTKVNKTEILEYKLSMAIADMGQGLLKMLMGLIALLAHGFMNILDLGRALYSQTLGDKSYDFDDMMEASDKRWNAIYPVIQQGANQSAKGMSEGARAVGESNIVDLSPIWDALKPNKPPEDQAALSGKGYILGDRPNLHNQGVQSQLQQAELVTAAFSAHKKEQEWANESEEIAAGKKSRTSKRQEADTPPAQTSLYDDIQGPPTPGSGELRVPLRQLAAEQQRLEEAAVL